MDTKNLLIEWMQRNGYTNRTLAAELGFTYDLIYMLTAGKRSITDGFRWRFAKRFGWEEAQAIFGSMPSSAPEEQPTPEPA